MKTVAFTDKIFATVSVCGRTIFNTSLNGMTSIEQVVRSVCAAIRGLATGMVTLIVRNGSQGWMERRSLRIGRPALAAVAAGVPTFAAPTATEGTQLLLF